MTFISQQRSHALCMAAKVVAACWWLALASGCASCPCSTTCCNFWAEPAAPKGQVSTILTYWDNRVRYAPDTLNNGAPLPGIAGRVLLVSDEHENAQMQNAEGAIVVDLYDLTPATNGGQPRMLERWQFDPDTLKRLKKNDRVGDGYTLFLPWSSYRPEIGQIKLQLSYLPGGGAPVYADPVLVSLRPDEPLHIHNRNVLPAQFQAPAKK